MNTQILKFTFKDRAILPEDEAYDEARTIYNAMIDKRPKAIVKCKEAQDVVQAVNFARNEGVEVSILSGGHNGAGLALVDDGLVIDLSDMKEVHVNPEAKTARVDGGCTWADVDKATHAHGLAVPSGLISTTGVGGLTLGGGHGYLTRKYGLTIDNLLEVDVVLADGRKVTASEKENEDLFWAVRGGGGNFGVITSFLFKAHPVDTVYAGPIIWPIDQADKIMRWYKDFIKDAPEDIYGWFGFHRVPTGSPLPEELHSKHGCVICWCYTGPMEKAEEIFKPIRELGTPVLDLVGEMPFPALQSMFDEMYYPPGLQWYWKADFVNEISDQAIELHKEYGSNLPSELSTMHLYPINGAVHNVDKNDTAFSYRDVTWSRVIVGVDKDPTNAEKVSNWAKQYWEALHPMSAGGGYVNFMMEEGEDRVKATYRDNYERLAKIKTKYDPDNFFHINQNIKPLKS
ncbi:FAD-binding oxidoreductase [Galbibacter sp. EGI 63066]|uniref:FAD-binding oxidoreductase n=1 Tax=Galbibacter sp. EGI 63066 TaxID=2993559 RepID=UPI0022496AFE|nr:FAD-binding oxidoreductase [Galbibacter sp. EGI 63066]MCX2680192.1 FAD-binding oxidoreductase [Galbibacter sp. EGI 63066]